MTKIKLHPDFKDFLRFLNSNNFIALEDLKRNKQACGSHKDLDDLEHLPSSDVMILLDYQEAEFFKAEFSYG
jgi:hypothetical protein